MATPSISELVTKGIPVYVQNLTREPRAVLTCTFHTPGRKPQTVFLPAVDHPVKLYPGMLSKHALLDGSEQLQRFLLMGALKLVSPKRARAILADPDIAKQVDLAISLVNSDTASRRYAENIKGKNVPGTDSDGTDEIFYKGPKSEYPTENMDNNPITQAVQQALVAAGVIQQSQAAPRMAPSRTAHQLSIAGVDPSVDPKVLGIVAGWTPDLDVAVLTALKSLSGLKQADFNYIVQNVGHGSRTHTWVTGKLAV